MSRWFLAVFYGLVLTIPATASNPAPSQVYYVPFPEDNQLAGYFGISTVSVDPLAVFVGFSASQDNTVIYYDHWEDGYEEDITDPKQSTTQVFGDGNPDNGYPPGNAGDLIAAGTVFSLRNYVTTTTLQSVLDFDARDKIASFKPISVTKTSFPAVTNTLLAGCVEVFEHGLWGNEYRVPVGSNMPTTTATASLTTDANIFEYSAISIMAGTAGTTVQIDADNNGIFEQTLTLGEGQCSYVAGVSVGGRVLSDKPIQVVLFTGRPGSTYQSRDTSLLPIYRWSSSYYAPVSTISANATVVFLYNPGATAITVSYDYRSSSSAYTTATVSVPAGGNARVTLTESDGTSNFGAYKFYTTGTTPPTFYAFCAVDAANVALTSNQAYDGGFTLVGQPSLTTQVLVSLGIGRDPFSTANFSENGNLVWITTAGNGNTLETVYVDYNGDNAGLSVDMNGNYYDVAYSLRELEQKKLVDPDGDQSGMLVYTLNPNVKIAAAWAQDPSVAAPGQPGLDVSTLIPPLREGDGSKKSSIALDADGDGYRSAGDTLEYDIRTINTARTAIVGPFTVKDALPVDLDYVSGTAKYRYSVAGAWQSWVPIPDDGSGTAFPMDDLGFDVPGTLGVAQQIQVVFRAAIKPVGSLTPGISRITNTGSVVVTPYGVTIGLEWTDILYSTIGDRVWIDTNADGVQDSGEVALNNVIVYADLNNNSNRDSGEPTSTTSGDGNYLITGLQAGTYTVRVDPNSVAAINPRYGPTFDLDGIATSYVASVTVSAAADRTDADFGFREGASVGDRIWVDRDGDGLQESGEPGINGVRVFIDANTNGFFDASERNSITFGDGNYYIGNLTADTYSVSIDSTTLPDGVTQTFDLDGTSTANNAIVMLIGAQHRGDLDFGYRGAQSIGDFVWEDVNVGSGNPKVTTTNYTIFNGRLDINNSGAADNDDDGFIGSMRIVNGYADIDNDASTSTPDANDDGSFLGVVIINGGFDVDVSSSITNADDGTVTYSLTTYESAIANVKVYLDANGNGLWENTEAFAITDLSGAYTISSLFNGSYLVRVDTTTLPPSMSQIYDLTSPLSDHQATVVLSGSSRTDVDFGYRNDASIGDRVWNDLNNNALQDAAEPGIEAVLVYIDANNNGRFEQGAERFEVTNNAGYYRFSGLVAGTYAVRVEISTLPRSVTQTYDLDGTATPNFVSRILSVSEDATNVDFGYRSLSSVGDFVWLDANANGLQDPGEAGINNVRVYLDLNGNGVFDSESEPSAITIDGGSYAITGLVTGTYTARVDPSTLPAGMTITSDLSGETDGIASFMLSPTQTRTDVDFGYVQAVAIGDRVWSDLNANGVQDSGEPGLDGVAVTLFNAVNNTIIGTSVSAEGGSYAFSNFLPGTYYVEFGTLFGYTRTLADQAGESADSDANATTGRTANFTLTSGQTNNTLDAGYYQPVTIGDFVWNDANVNGQQDVGETGLAGVTVTLTRPRFGPDGIADNLDDNTAVSSFITFSDGGYSFIGLPPGNYQISFGALPGYNRTLADQGDGATDSDAIASTGLTTILSIAAGQTDNTLDAGYYQTSVINGFVLADSNNDNIGDLAITGVTLTLYSDPNGDGDPADGVVIGSLIVSDSSGAYSFTNLAPGSYVVVETQPSDYLTVIDGDTTNPGDDTINASSTDNAIPVTVVSGETDDGNNFIEEQIATISGHLYIDSNGNGTQDNGEPNLPNVDVLIRSSTDVLQIVTTDTNGNWTASVPPGTTSAKVKQDDPDYPFGSIQTQGDDPTSFTAVAGIITSGGIDGYFIPGAIAGFVLADTNNDDIGDTPIVGVTLLLVDVNGSAVDGNPNILGVQLVTTLSQGNGFYSFGGISPGIYGVVETQPSGYNSVSDKDGGNPDEIRLITVTNGVTNSDNNFVEEQPGSISGVVLADTDGDGSGDVPLAGVVIRLLDSYGFPVLSGGNPITTTTLANGSYSFTGVSPGSYCVAENQPLNYGSVSDTDGPNDNVIGNVTPINVTANTNNGDNNFVEVELGIISGYVRIDTDSNGSGDVPLAGVILNLLNSSGNPVVDGLGNPVRVSTNVDGFYNFTLVPVGSYRVSQNQPAGYGSVSDVDGANNNVIGDLNPILMTPGLVVTGRNFVEVELGRISGYVYVGTAPLAGVTLTLLNTNGSPVLDGNGEPITTVTNSLGSYNFSNIFPGSYQVAQNQPSGYDSFGDIDGGDINIVGDVTRITIQPGQHSENNNFIETLDTCPDDWAQWKAQHPGQVAAGNPDHDGYDNFAEFAFAMPSENGTGSVWLGNTAWIIRPSTLALGKIEGVFIRPKGAPLNVTYTLEYAATLGTPTLWQAIEITPLLISKVDNGDCTETVIVHDLERITGLTSEKRGVIRIKAELDEVPATGTDHTSYSEAEGWKETLLDLCCRTYSNPFLRESVFTGRVSGVAGQSITLALSGGSVDLSSLFAAGGAFYLEVTSGDNEGHRFDILSASGNTMTVASDSSLFAGIAPFNTLKDAPPSNLADDQITIRRHWTLNEVFPASGFGATGSQSSADQVQFFIDGAWIIYWLYDLNDGDPATARWVATTDSSMIDQGGTVLPPGQGIFFFNRTSRTSILAYGEIRGNDFIRPLNTGSNLVAGGYPVDQSIGGVNGRGMNLSQGFFGSLDFKTADSIYLWKADTAIDASGYESFYLLHGAPNRPSLLRWVKVGDASAAVRDLDILFEGNRSVFVRSKGVLGKYKITKPWSP